MSAEQSINQRLSSFHCELDRLATIADQKWLEGGLTWSASFEKHEPKITGTELALHFEQCVHEWSILLWYIHGCPHSDDYYVGDISISLDDVRAFQIEAKHTLTSVCPKNETEKSYLLVNCLEAGWVSFEFTFLSGKHALRHTGFWSVD